MLFYHVKIVKLNPTNVLLCNFIQQKAVYIYFPAIIRGEILLK